MSVLVRPHPACEGLGQHGAQGAGAPNKTPAGGILAMLGAEALW